MNHHLAHISAKYRPFIGRVSSDTQPVYLLTVGQVSVEYRLSVGHGNYWLGIGQEMADVLTNTRQIVEQCSGHISADV